MSTVELVLAALIGLAGAGASAAGPTATIDDVVWSAPPECPDREALLAGIARRRGRALAPGEVRVVVRVLALGSRRYRMELELEVRGHSEARVLNARTCVALVDAAALRIALALAVDGDETSMELPREPVAPPVDLVDLVAPMVPEPSPEPVAEPVAPGPAAVEMPLEPFALEALPGGEPERRRCGGGGFLRAHGLGEGGALPGPRGGLGLAGGLLWRWVRLEVHATYLAPRALVRPQAKVRASLVAGAVNGCARLGRGPLEIPVCGGLEVGGMPITAVGPGIDAAAIGRWVAVVASVGANWRVTPRVGIWAVLQGLGAVGRNRFVLRDPGPEGLPLFDPGPLSARLSLGVELRFGDPR